MSIEPSLFRKCFPQDALVRELGPEEIRALKLPITYWCEHMRDFPVWSLMTGSFVIPGRTPSKLGFLSDGASVPDLTYNLVSDTAPYILFPAYAHDFLFSVHGILPNGRKLSLHQCNQAIGYWMRICQAEAWRISAVRLGLAAGSWVYWNNSKPTAKVESAKS